MSATMANGINKDFVGVDIDSGGHWSFIVPSGIARISECVNNFEVATHELFAACEGFIRPTEIEYSVRKYSSDGRIGLTDPDPDTEGVELQSVERKTIADESGLADTDIPFNSYTQHNQAQNEGVYFIGDIEFTRAQTLLTLNDYDGWLDRTDEQYVKPTRRGKVLNEQIEYDPINIHLSHMAASAQTSDPDMEFVIRLTSSTDIWFKETRIGRANRRRLETFFKRLLEQFDVVDISITPRQTSAKVLRTLLPNQLESNIKY